MTIPIHLCTLSKSNPSLSIEALHLLYAIKENSGIARAALTRKTQMMDNRGRHEGLKQLFSAKLITQTKSGKRVNYYVK